MTPGNIEPKEGTKVVELAAPKDWNTERNGLCETLKIRVSFAGGRDLVMQSVWYPTEEERRGIAAGLPVILTVWGAQHPPVSIDVDRS